ncbi:MAG TPA: LPXTG cell wall anchor domain-containing protein [Actinomycetota bacterium]|jgi:LPXTG-motif cell wall-anchored protein|nr:LPXTG cell wall anchor domain-containing protein [Actinomycetota bacterium]
MSSTKRARFLRVVGASAVALAIAAGPLARGAAAVDLAGFAGTGDGFALRVVVDLSGLPDAVKQPIQDAYTTLRDGLPDEGKALLPESFPFTIDQRLLETLAEMGTSQKAQAFLSRGLLELPDKAEASEEGDSSQVNTAAKNIPSDDLPILNASVGELLATVGAGPTATGSGKLTSVTASLEMVSDLFPAELQTAFDDLTSQMNAALGTAQSTLDTVLGGVASSFVDEVANNDILGGLLGDAGLGDVLGGEDPVGDLTDALVGALDLGTVTDLLSGSLAAVNNLDNDSAVERTTEVAGADASSKIGSVDVLGLLSATAIDLSAHSEAAGSAGTAKNTSSCEIGSIKVGGTDGISFDGKSLTVAGTDIPVPLDQVDAVKGVVDDVLAAIGVVGDVGVCDESHQADAEGTSAAQRVSAFHVELGLQAPEAVGEVIGAGDQLVRIVIDPTVETAVAAQVATPDSKPALPKTGSPTIVTILSGMAMAGGSLLLRRRV